MSDRTPARRGDRPRPSPRRPKLRNQILFVLGIVVLAAGAFYTALVVATQIDHIFFPDSEIRLGLPKLPGIDSGESASATEISGGRINILVMGLDARPADGGLGRSDTMFVMTIDPSTKTARGLAMPRDLYVDIPFKSGTGSYKDRINTAYIIGESQNYPGGGASLAKTVVERLLGIKINYYVIIDFNGFKQVIDRLGGIDVDVPALLSDPQYSETERLGDFYPCVFQPGVHHMNGSDALCYARVRRNSSDLDRIQRQQRIMFAVMERATQLKVLADPSNALSLWKNYKSAVHTDINDLQIPGFAKLAANVDADRLAFLSLGAATTPFTTSEGAAVLLPSQAGIKQIVEAFLSDNRLQQEAATIEVQNGTNQQGQATKAVDYLASLGIPQTSLTAGNAPDNNHARTEIVDFSGKRYTAERLASWFGVPTDRVRSGTETDATLRKSPSDILVILGTDAKLESAVAAPSR